MGLDHHLVHLAGGSKAPKRKVLICSPRSQLSLLLRWVLDRTMIKASRCQPTTRRLVDAYPDFQSVTQTHRL